MNQPTLPFDLPPPLDQTSLAAVPLGAVEDLAVLLFDAGIDTTAVWAHATDLLADPTARPDPDCLLCIAGLANGAWPSNHRPTLTPERRP